MTVVADKLTDPTGRFVPGSVVRTRLVASTVTEGAGMVPSELATRQSWRTLKLTEAWVTVDLDATDGANILPTGAFHYWESQVPFGAAYKRGLVVPTPPATVTTAQVDFATFTQISVTSTSGFDLASEDAPKLVYVGSRLVSYTERTGTSFKGCVLLKGSVGALASPASVQQAYWVPDIWDPSLTFADIVDGGTP